MDKLGYLESFLAVLDHGSLSAAGRIRNLSQPAISQQMTALEAFYGAPLLQRSTTGVRPTRAGGIVASHASRLIEEHQQMQAELAALATAPKGPLRISLSQFMGQSTVGDEIQALHGQYPDLSLVLKVEDHLVDVVRDGYDLALRTGTLGETGGIVRKIGRLATTVVAAPSYLDKMGHAESHRDLKRYAYVQYAEHRLYGVLGVSRDGRELEAEVVTGIIVDTPQHLINALVNGYGIARLPKMFADPLIREGKVETVLPDFEIEPKSVFLIYPHRHALTHGAKLVIQAIYRGLAEFDHLELLHHSDLKTAA